MFAGDKLKPAANAIYKNLIWENFYVDHSFHIGNKIRGIKEIGTIDSLGPFFRVSFDLIIHSLRKNELSHVLGFIYERAEYVIYLHRSGHIEFVFILDKMRHYFIFKIELNHWYNILIEQKSVNGKVIRLYMKLSA